MDAPLIPLYVVAFAALYFQILMLVSIVGAYEQHTRARHKRAAHHPTHTWPSVAIIVPCFNEERTVAKTIHSLLALHYPADKLEIIVVDDGSTDATYARAAAARNDSIEAARAANRHIPTITLRRQENGGKHTAMNWGITHTKASFVGCLDADSEVAPDALTHIIPFFADAHVAAVTPAIHIRNPQTIWQHMQKAEYGIGVIMKMAHGYLDAIHVTPGPFSIFRRSVFSTIGLFRRAHNVEDMEIAYRLQDHGFKIKNCPDAHVYTVSPATLPKLFRQRVRWVGGFMKNTFDYRHLLLKKHCGNLGTITLPFGIVTLCGALYGMGLGTWHYGRSLLHTIEQWSLLHFSQTPFATLWQDMRHFHLTTHLFAINTSMLSILGLTLVGVTIGMLLISSRIIEGRWRLSRGSFYFLVLYGFVTPLWLIRATYDTVTWRPGRWR